MLSFSYLLIALNLISYGHASSSIGQCISDPITARSGLSTRARLSEECKRLSLQPVVRPNMQQCHGTPIAASSRSAAPGSLESVESGIDTQECLNGCFARVTPGPDKQCLCMNGTTAENCYKGEDARLDVLEGQCGRMRFDG